ncbi:hypothetical protein [Hyalangium rubrum]|uniref:Lipoprotein n=1 Tax=Hyalangium rubrum TaxID=3103134 RepID=A0ABU5GWT1_9BACT|nr:hypothetical protein [Hyalangium sp. s54d21]MDY7225653.1 hypothetical protein [Hyalangium sp. s54d21]
MGGQPVGYARPVMSMSFLRPWSAPGRLVALLVPLCLLSLACPEDDPPPSPPVEDPNAVTGHRTLHRRLESGDVRTTDATGVLSTLTVLVPTGDTFETRQVISMDADTFKFENVPQGTYYLRRGTGSYVITEQRELDLDESVLGREGVVTVAADIPVTLSVDGLAPMDAGQDLEVVAPNAGAAGTLDLGSAASAGATAITGQRVEYRSAFGRQEVIDGTQGDRLYLLQHLRRTEGAFNYQSVVRALILNEVTFRADGQAATVSGTFSAVAPQPITLDWRRSSFEAHRAAAHPLAVPLTASSVRQSLILAPAVGGTAEGAVGYAGELLSGNITAGNEDVSIPMEYGNPYPATWGVVASVVHRYQVPLRLPGTTGTVGVSLKDQAELGTFLSRPVQARLSPPNSLQVNGRNAQEEQDLASLTPLFTWEPPMLGTADAYELRIFRLYTEPTAPTVTFAETVATFLTAQRRVRVPPGVLRTGESYVVRIGAMHTPGVDLTRTPYRLNTLVDYALAESVTSVLHAP